MNNSLRKGAISAIVCGFSIALSVGAIAPASADQPYNSIDVEDLVPEFAAIQKTDDRIPDELRIIEQANLDDTSTRLLAVRDSGRSWVALDRAGNICIVTRLSDDADGYPEDAEITGASCGTPAHFYHFGASLRLEGNEGMGIVAHLLPARVGDNDIRRSVMAARDASGSALVIEQVSPHLVTLDLESADSVDPVVISPTDQRQPPITLPALSPVG